MFADPINGHRQQFIELCKSHRVKELYAFGSAVNGPFTASSDVDLLVELEQGILSKPASGYGPSGTAWSCSFSGKWTFLHLAHSRTR